MEDNDDIQPLINQSDDELVLASWGNVIVLSNFFVMCSVFGLLQSQSFFYVEWLDYFEADAAEVSLLTSLSLLLLGIFSPLAGMLATKFGSRAITMIGGILVALGMMLGVLLDTFIGLILTWGVVTGIGFAFVYSPSVAMLGQYFTRHFTAANSFMLTGASAGMILAPFLTDILIDEYGWRGAMLVLSAISANLIAGGATLRRKDHSTTDIRIAIPLQSPADDAAADSINTNHEGSIIRILGDLIGNVPYMIVVLIFLLQGLILMSPNINVIERAIEAGIPKSQASMLPTILGIGNLFGRLSGFAIEAAKLSRDAANVGSFVITTATFFLNPLCNTYATQVLYCFVFGFGQGAVIVFCFVLAQELIPDSHRAIGVGFVSMAIFSGFTVGIVLAGWLYDATGGYVIPFYVMGAISVICTALVIVVAIINRRNRRSLKYRP